MTTIYKTVKCSLNGILLHPEETAPLIEQRCLAVSQMAVRASLLCRVMVDELLKQEDVTEWPDFDSLNVFVKLFTKGSRIVGKTRILTPAIEWTWDNKFKDAVSEVPPTNRYHSDYNLIAYCAKTFQTSFLNNLKLNFDSRQRRAIRTYYRSHNSSPSKVPNTLVYALQTLINGWDYKGRTYSVSQLKELNDKHLDFVDKHKQHLPGGGLSSSDYLRYYHFLRTEYSDDSTKLKNIPLVPRNAIKMHYIDFDAVGVKGLCHDIGIPNLKNEKNKRKEEDRNEKLKREGWNKIFKLGMLEKMGGGLWTFDRCVATDGVGCSVRYYREVNEVKKKRRKNDGTATAACVNPPSEQLCLEGKRLIGIDPGRKNIAFCVELDSGDTRKIVKKTKLTSKQYYCDSGHTKHKKRVQSWMAAYKSVNEELSQTTVGSKDYLNKLYRRDVHDVIWRTKTAKKWRRDKFRVYCLKKKTLDNFVNKVVGSKKPLHVAFGAAKFASTGKGENYSSPAQRVGKMIKRRVGPANFTECDEWNTSKVCHRCMQPLSVVGKIEEGKKVYLRGLRRCSAQSKTNNEEVTCPIGGAFLDRDANAAANIAQKLFIFSDAERLMNLTRGTKVEQNIFWLSKPHHATSKMCVVRLSKGRI